MFILVLFTIIQASPVAAETPAFIRIVHASPDVGTVDVFMDGKKLLSSFQYASVSNYLPLPSGPHDLKIALIGKGINASVITQTLPVDTGKAYTIAAIGMQSDKSLSLNVFEDDNTIAGNTAKVRIYHLSPGAGSVDVDEDTHKVVGGIKYSQASNYISVPAGMYTFNVTITSVNTSIPIATQLSSWTVTSLFAIGLPNGNPKLKFVTAQTTGTPALPQTGGGPVKQTTETLHSIIWYLALLACLLVCVVCGSRCWMNVWLDSKRK
jgi:hypothetical protein